MVKIDKSLTFFWCKWQKSIVLVVKQSKNWMNWMLKLFKNSMSFWCKWLKLYFSCGGNYYQNSTIFGLNCKKLNVLLVKIAENSMLWRLKFKSEKSIPSNAQKSIVSLQNLLKITFILSTKCYERNLPVI